MIPAANDFPLADFRAALIAAGATLEASTNEWEILRYRLAGKFSNVYRNAKGKVTLCGGSLAHFRHFRAGTSLVATDAPAPAPRKAAPIRRKVTLYTDASSYHATKAGAWAAVLITPDGADHEASGALKGDIHSSTAAETRAVANALWHFVKAGLILRGDAVRVVCDNTATVGYMNGRKPRQKSVGIKEPWTFIKSTASKCALQLSGEWIKGHQPAHAAEADERVKWNRRADALAGEHGKALNLERKGS